MGRLKKNFMDRLLQMPEAAELIAKDIASYQNRCLSGALRNWGKPESERVPVPLVTERTFERLAFLEALFNDVAFKESQSKKGSIPKKDFTLEEVQALVDIWADRMLRDGENPDKRGWKEFVFRNLNLSAWSVVANRLKRFGTSEADLVDRMRGHNSPDLPINYL